MEEDRNKEQNEKIFSKTFKAGKRFYFFDVRTTRNSDFYLTITESKRHQNADNSGYTIEKFKIFLYKEDFEKFKGSLNEALEFIEEQENLRSINDKQEEPVISSYSNVQFDDI
jgi:hypothetical protein